MSNFADFDEPLFTDLIERVDPVVPDPPFSKIFKLLELWDYLSKGETSTTAQIREALRKDLEELGISA